MSKVKRIAVMTSGGDSSGMNPCIRSVVRTGLYNGIEVMGIRNGYQGMIDDEIFPMTTSSVSGIINRGGTILYTARCKQWQDLEGRQQGYDNLRRYGIDALIVIGGDGSYRGAKQFMEDFDFPVICCPGTIDNDIAGTDYTLGYDTAVNVAMDAIDKIRDTATSHGRLFIVEVMGRHAGYIALEVGIAAGAEDILIPETKSDIPDVIDNLDKGKKKGKRSSIVVVAEGDETGGAYNLKDMIEDSTGYPTRVTILGHLQRGGSPTAHERLMASRFGFFAIEGIKESKFGTAVGSWKDDTTFTPIEEAVQKLPRLKQSDLELVKALRYSTKRAE